MKPSNILLEAANYLCDLQNASKWNSMGACDAIQQAVVNLHDSLPKNHSDYFTSSLTLEEYVDGAMHYLKLFKPNNKGLNDYWFANPLYATDKEENRRILALCMAATIAMDKGE